MSVGRCTRPLACDGRQCSAAVPGTSARPRLYSVLSWGLNVRVPTADRCAMTLVEDAVISADDGGRARFCGGGSSAAGQAAGLLSVGPCPEV